MSDNKDQAAGERIKLIYQQSVAGERINPCEVAKVAVALERIITERDVLKDRLDKEPKEADHEP